MDETETKENETFADSGDDEKKAKEKLNQKREARRRKILDNAKNRLERLNGRTAVNAHTTTSSTLDGNEIKGTFEHMNGPNHIAVQSGEFSDPEVEPDILTQNLRPFRREPFPFSGPDLDGTTTLHQNMPWGESQASDNFTNIFNLFEAPTPVQKRHIFFRARLHIVISAMISCILTIFWRANGFSIFIPPGLCVITDLLFFREPKPLNPILNMILMIVNTRLLPQARNCLHLLGIIQSIIVDLGVFVFSFCSLFYVISICTNNLFTDLINMK